MIDLASATQAAIFDALGQAGSIRIPVFQHVPENTPPPVIIIGAIAIEQIGGKGDRLERHEVEILTVISGPSRLPLQAAQEAIRATLEEQPLPLQAGAELSQPALTDTAPVAAIDTENGPQYIGAQSFLIFAQPA